MNNIKLIIFDLSGVCFDIEEPPYLEKFIKLHNLEHDNFLERYDELLKKAEVGEGTGIELWNTLSREYNIDANPKEIIKEMMNFKLPHRDILDLASKLKGKYAVIYLTNYNKDYWDEILRRFDFNDWFSWGVVSYEIGFRKPAKEGFEYILQKSAVRPEEAVFIDDTAKNLEQPKALGIKTINFRDKAALLNELANLGVKIS